MAQRIKEDRRILKTKMSIMNAFVDLLTEKGDQRITITEIAQKANIGRKTFYLHYDCIDDVVKDLEKLLETQIYGRASAFLKSDKAYDISLIFSDLNSLIMANLPLLRKISNSNYYFFFQNLCKGVILSTIKLILTSRYVVPKDEIDSYADFYASGISALYADWFKGNASSSIDELSQIAINSVFKGLDRFKRALI